MTHNQIELIVQELTNTHYSFYDIGYNDKVIYLSDGWEDIEINFKYTLTEEYDVIIHSIEK